LALILPVRLRRVASGLMMERVRSMAMEWSFACAGPGDSAAGRGGQPLVGAVETGA
jgi:hypothetical protein